MSSPRGSRGSRSISRALRAISSPGVRVPEVFSTLERDASGLLDTEGVVRAFGQLGVPFDGEEVRDVAEASGAVESSGQVDWRRMLRALGREQQRREREGGVESTLEGRGEPIHVAGVHGPPSFRAQKRHMPWDGRKTAVWAEEGAQGTGEAGMSESAIYGARLRGSQKVASLLRDPPTALASPEPGRAAGVRRKQGPPPKRDGLHSPGSTSPTQTPLASPIIPTKSAGKPSDHARHAHSRRAPLAPPSPPSPTLLSHPSAPSPPSPASSVVPSRQPPPAPEHGHLEQKSAEEKSAEEKDGSMRFFSPAPSSPSSPSSPTSPPPSPPSSALSDGSRNGIGGGRGGRGGRRWRTTAEDAYRAPKDRSPPPEPHYSPPKRKELDPSVGARALLHAVGAATGLESSVDRETLIRRAIMAARRSGAVAGADGEWVDVDAFSKHLCRFGARISPLEAAEAAATARATNPSDPTLIHADTLLRQVFHETTPERVGLRGSVEAGEVGAEGVREGGGGENGVDFSPSSPPFPPFPASSPSFPASLPSLPYEDGVAGVGKVLEAAQRAAESPGAGVASIRRKRLLSEQPQLPGGVGRAVGGYPLPGAPAPWTEEHMVSGEERARSAAPWAEEGFETAVLPYRRLRRAGSTRPVAYYLAQDRRAGDQSSHRAHVLENEETGIRALESRVEAVRSKIRAALPVKPSAAESLLRTRLRTADGDKDGHLRERELFSVLSSCGVAVDATDMSALLTYFDPTRARPSRAEQRTRQRRAWSKRLAAASPPPSEEEALEMERSRLRHAPKYHPAFAASGAVPLDELVQWVKGAQGGHGVRKWKGSGAWKWLAEVAGPTIKGDPAVGEDGKASDEVGRAVAPGSPLVGKPLPAAPRGLGAPGERVGWASSHFRFTQFRNRWEERHGREAAKEMHLDDQRAAEAPSQTWTSAPGMRKPFKVLTPLKPPPPPVQHPEVVEHK